MAKPNGGLTGLQIPALGELHMPPKKREDFGNIWVDMISPNLANQLFRKRLAELRKSGGGDLFESLISGGIKDFDEAGEITHEAIEGVFGCFIGDWGMYDDDRNPMPLLDADGNEVACTLENFISIVRNTDGGAELFFLIIDKIRVLSEEKISTSDREKNSSARSGALSESATKKSTQKTRTRRAGSTSSERRSAKPRSAASS